MTNDHDSGFFSSSNRTPPAAARHDRGCMANDSPHHLKDAMPISPRFTTRLLRRAAPAVLMLALAAPATCQTLPPYAKEADLSGPRFGLTLLSDGVVKKIHEEGTDIGP